VLLRKRTHLGDMDAERADFSRLAQRFLSLLLLKEGFFSVADFDGRLAGVAAHKAVHIGLAKGRVKALLSLISHFDVTLLGRLGADRDAHLV